MLEKELRKDLEVVLDNEELLWKQKSRNEWIAFGGRNTKYFHSQVNKRRRRNSITALRLRSGDWCYDEEKIKSEVVYFFKVLYIEDGPNGVPSFIHGDFPSVEPYCMSSLETGFCSGSLRLSL